MARRNKRVSIRSTSLTVMVILSAALFLTLVALAACRTEVFSRSTPKQVVHAYRMFDPPPAPGPPPPPVPTSQQRASVYSCANAGVADGVVGDVAGAPRGTLRGCEEIDLSDIAGNPSPLPSPGGRGR